MRRAAFTLFLLLIAVPALPWTFQWGAVTKYTDGSTIFRPVTYTVWDNAAGPAPLATGIVATNYPLSAVGSNVLHRYQVAAEADGVQSTRTEVVWTSPPLSPAAPAGAAVVP